MLSNRLYFCLIAAGLVLIVLPAWMVAKPMPRGFVDNADIAAYALVAVAFVMRALRSRRQLVGVSYSRLTWSKAIGCALYLALYMMASLLCRRLGLGHIPEGALSFLGPLGLVALAIAASGLIKGELPRVGVSYPLCTALLIAMLAFPLVQLAWLPLLALPGVFTVMVWSIKRHERALPVSIDGHIELLADSGDAQVEKIYRVLPRVW